MSEQKIERAKTLMARGEYAKARAIIAIVDHPLKKRWLMQIDQRIAHERQNSRARRQRLMGLSAVVVIVVIVAIVAVVFNRVIHVNEVVAIPTLQVLQPVAVSTASLVPSMTTTSSESPVIAGNTQPPLDTATSQSTSQATTENAVISQPTQLATISETTVSSENTQALPTSTVTPTPQPYNQRVEVPLNQSASHDQVLRLARFTFEKTPSGINSVVLEVQNISDSPQSGVAWYLLSLPGSTQPWINPAFSSTEQPIQNLPEGQTITLTFDGVPSDFATGTYTLSAWVHRIDPITGERTHQDGMGYLQPVSIAPLFALDMNNVQVSTVGGQSSISLFLKATNNTATEANIALSYTLTGNDTTDSYKEPLQVITLPSDESYSHTYTVMLPLHAGTYLLTAWLYRYDGDTPKPVAGLPYQTPIVIQ